MGPVGADAPAAAPMNAALCSVCEIVKALTNSEPKYLTITIRRNWSVQASPFRYQCLGC
jgi:hypothetical protein